MKVKRPYPEKHFPDTLTFEDALRFNDDDLVQHLIRKGLKPDSCGSSGKPLLLEAIIAGKGSVEYVLTQAGATEKDFTDAERQEAALHREPLYCRRKEWMSRPLLELCREQMQAAEAAGDWEKLANLRDRERRLTFKARVFNQSAFQTLLSDLEAAGIEVPDLNEWPEDRRKPTSRAMLAMDILLEKGDSHWLKRLLDTGVNPNEYIYDEEGDSELPLCKAIEYSPSLVPLLLKYGADPSGDGWDDIPLMDAISTYPSDESDSLVEQLLDAGANPFVERWNGATPLLNAVVDYRYQLATRLLEMGVNPNPDDAEELWKLPLVQAIADANVGLVRELLDAGASPFLIPNDAAPWDTDGQCPLYVAEDWFHDSAILPYKEAEDKRRRKHGRRVLESIYERYPDIDRLPLPPDRRNKNADHTAYFNASLWNTAAYGLHKDTITLLHYFGASPNACNKAGIPALVIAAARGHTETVYELLCYGATPELPPHLLAAAGGTGQVKEEIQRLIQCFKQGGETSLCTPY